MITINGAMRTAHGSITARLSQRFQVAERRSTVRAEVVGGVTTFAVMAYIIFLNPFLLTLNGEGQAPQVASFAGIATATCLAAALMTIAMGWYANYPFALAPSLGISDGPRGRSDREWRAVGQAAMGLLVVGGLLVTALVVLGLGDALVRAILPRLGARLAWASACCCSISGCSMPASCECSPSSWARHASP
ncbi:MAG: hypothetical protein IPO81_28025 [Kouleothrix sp.]|nr:hypothetical protein [Kouleothrix sp.]